MNTFLFKLINDNRNPVLDFISTVISSYLFIALAILLVMLCVVFSPKIIHKTRTMALIILAVCFNLLLANVISKNILFSPRPYVVLENVHVLGVVQKDSTLPSSHVSLAASVLIALVWYNPFLWPWLFFVLIMGWSRIYNGMHWPGDILLGIMTGFVSVWISFLILKPFHFPGILERKE